MMARQSAAQSGKRGFQASLRSTFRRGRQITTMRAIRQEGPPPDLGGEEPKKTPPPPGHAEGEPRSEEHTSELQSLMRISYAVFCLKKKIQLQSIKTQTQHCLQHES